MRVHRFPPPLQILLAAYIPLAAAGQEVSPITVTLRPAHQSARPEWPLTGKPAPSPPLSADELSTKSWPLGSGARRGSAKKYALWGGAIGGAIGLAVGVASYNNSRCTDCWVPNEVIPPYGFVIGAAAGVLIGVGIHAVAGQSP